MNSILLYTLPNAFGDFIGGLVLIAAFGKVILHLYYLKNSDTPKLNRTEFQLPQLSNLFVAGVMIPVKTNNNNLLKIINILIYVVYICTVILFSQFIF